MNSFYVSMIFLGMILIVASLVWVALEKKSSFSLLNRMEEKKQDVVAIINDAEQMIEELNKFSDYIITQIDSKNQELLDSLKLADKEIKKSDEENSVRYPETEVTSIESVEPVIPDQKPVKNEKVVSLNSKHNEVIRLANEGLSETEIAQKMNIGKGEIQLIIELNKQNINTHRS